MRSVVSGRELYTSTGVPPAEFTPDFRVVNRGYDPGDKLRKGSGDEMQPGAKGWTRTTANLAKHGWAAADRTVPKNV